MYVMFGLLLTILAIIEVGNGDSNKKRLFTFLILLMTVLLAVRYGQGSDYYGYYLQYSRIDSSASLFVNMLYHGELGWYMILVIANRLGFNFEVFIAILSMIMMFSIGRAIKKYSPYKIWSLLILYPTFYLTYCFSAIRQGLVMSLFLGFGLDLLLEKKWVKYYILMVVLILFHKSAIVLLFLPVLMNFKERKIGKYCVFAMFFCVFFGYSGILNRVAAAIGIAGYFNVSISVMAILLRTILFFVIYMLHHENCFYLEQTGFSINELEKTLYFIYFIGYVVYLTLAFAGTLSQRITMPLKAIEVVLLPLLLFNLKNRSKITGSRFKYLKIGKLRIAALAMLVVFMLNVETIKNINSYIEQGNYYSWVNPLNYPYSTIFDKKYIRGYLSHFDDEVN